MVLQTNIWVTMMTKKQTTIKDSIPAGYGFAADTPEGVDPELVRIAFKAVLGGLVGIGRTVDDDVRRTFTIRFIASIIGEANAAIHSAQMANRLNTNDPKTIIDQLLKSLKHEK